MNLSAHILKIAKAAKKASYKMALISKSEKNHALMHMANALEAKQAYLIKENTKDLAAASKANYSSALIDRLTLNPKRITAMADGLRETAKLKDPVGELLETIHRPNGLLIKKIRVPLGVVGIIYESRPNVTADCAALCLKSGNAAILKGGKEAIHSNMAIFKILKSQLKKTKIPMDALQLIESTDRQAVQELLKLDQHLDVIVPRGGEGLIRFVADHSRIPVIKHYHGVCHVYVGSKADLKMAHKITMNAKTQKPGVCNAMETLLVDRTVAKTFLPAVVLDLQKAGCEIRGDAATRAIVRDGVKKATEEDWRTEYLDLILSVRVVEDMNQAIEHINTYGSHHSDTIVTKDKKQAQDFLDAVDSACVYANASTRFTDGFEFGFGAEVGISTDKLHVRGPMALEGLTSYKYEIYGNGQVRKMKRIGILGGSFDPIHFGHLLMAQSAAEALTLDAVFFVPAFCSPFKTKHPLPDASKRLVMVKEAIKGNRAFKLYDGELRRGQVSYTIETLKELKTKYPQSKFYLLMGADNLRTFHRWKDPQGILKLASLVILNRPGFDKNYPKRWPFLKINMPAVDISSSDIRQRLSSRKSIWYLTPKAVIRYIRRYRLYGIS